MVGSGSDISPPLSGLLYPGRVAVEKPATKGPSGPATLPPYGVAFTGEPGTTPCRFGPLKYTISVSPAPFFICQYATCVMRKRLFFSVYCVALAA